MIQGSVRVGYRIQTSERDGYMIQGSVRVGYRIQTSERDGVNFLKKK